MYILSILYLIILFCSIRVEKSSLTKNKTCILKGICAMNILILHIAQNIPNITTFFPFFFIGNISVACFLFLSGYGLMYSLDKNKDYLDNFIPKKFKKIFLPYILVVLIYGLLLILTGQTVNLKDFVLGILLGKDIGPYWYMTTLFLMYFSFYFVYKNNKKDKANIIFLCLVILYTMLEILFKFEGHWYISTIAFYLGIIYEQNEIKIQKIFEKKYITYLLIFSCSFLVVFIIRNILCYLNIIKLPLIDNIIQFAITILFINCILIVLMRIDFKSKILNIIGKYSYCIYLIHPIVLKLISNNSKLEINDVRIIFIVTITFTLSILLDNLLKIGNKHSN